VQLTDWWRAPWLRLAAVFVVALVGLGILAGKSLTRPSRDNHFVHLATGWADGRLHHEGFPPGYCTPELRRARKCTGHMMDDWAFLKTLTLRDGTTVRAYPCLTKTCKQARTDRRVDTWWIVGEGWKELPRGSVAKTEEVWYVGFPPGPAVVMFPFAVVWGVGVWDVLLTAIAAALIPVVLVRLFDRERGIADGRGVQHLVLAVAWTFASPACFLGANGRVWFTAQIFGALMLVLFLDSAWRCRRPAWAGIWLALAIACRPTMAIAALFFGLEWWRESKRPLPFLRFALPVLIGGALLMIHNDLRFEDPFEFGHRFLYMRWQDRVQEHGMFSTIYLERNLQCLLTLLPVVTVDGVRFSIHGSALWLGSPWLLSFVWARTRFPQRLGLWLTALALAIPPLLYQNSGQTQFTYRFAVDWLPCVVIALCFGGAGRRLKLLVPLVVLGAALQIYGTWMFARRPAELFVPEPIGWPFESEFEEG
jgi:hypothetical protein